MPALDASGADRIAQFRTLWESRNATDSPTVAALFKRTAEILKAEGYDRYSRTEDETAAGLTLFEGVEQAAREEATRRAARVFGQGELMDDKLRVIELDTNALADELVTRLAGVLISTGQVDSLLFANDLTEVVWSWTRNALYGRVDMGAQYLGIEHVTRLLDLAAAMTVLIEA